MLAAMNDRMKRAEIAKAAARAAQALQTERYGVVIGIARRTCGPVATNCLV